GRPACGPTTASARPVLRLASEAAAVVVGPRRSARCPCVTPRQLHTIMPAGVGFTLSRPKRCLDEASHLLTYCAYSEDHPQWIPISEQPWPTSSAWRRQDQYVPLTSYLRFSSLGCSML